MCACFTDYALGPCAPCLDSASISAPLWSMHGAGKRYLGFPTRSRCHNLACMLWPKRNATLLTLSIRRASSRSGKVSNDDSYFQASLDLMTKQTPVSPTSLNAAAKGPNEAGTLQLHYFSESIPYF